MAIDRLPGAPKPRNTLGNVLAALGRPEEALAAFAQALALAPGFVEAAYNHATTCLLIGRFEEAEAGLRALMEGGVASPPVISNRVTALLRLKRNHDAVRLCRDGLAAHPGDPTLTANLAEALELTSDWAGAEPMLDDLVEAARTVPRAAIMRARLLRRLKRLDEARAALAEIDPSRLTGDDAIELEHERAMTLDASGPDHAEAAFAALVAYNRLVARSPEANGVDAERYARDVAAWDRWTRARAPRPPDAEGVAGPVFFVGFPRSGTTLMEQILKAHPRVVTTEERSPLQAVADELVRMAGDKGAPYPAVLDEVTAQEMASLRRTFEIRAEEVAGPRDGGRLLVDKLPLNIARLGLAERLLPGAKVLVALRDPRDVVLSCLMQRFRLTDAMASFLDQETTARTYAAVMDVWQAFAATTPLPVHVYRYEDLVVDFDGVVRPVLDFLGLAWDDSLRDYRARAQARDIRTPSYAQVTEALNTRAVRRWEKHRERLAPVLPILAPFVRAFGYDD